MADAGADGNPMTSAQLMQKMHKFSLKGKNKLGESWLFGHEKDGSFS